MRLRTRGKIDWEAVWLMLIAVVVFYVGFSVLVRFYERRRYARMLDHPVLIHVSK